MGRTDALKQKGKAFRTLGAVVARSNRPEYLKLMDKLPEQARRQPAVIALHREFERLHNKIDEKDCKIMDLNAIIQQQRAQLIVLPKPIPEEAPPTECQLLPSDKPGITAIDTNGVEWVTCSQKAKALGFAYSTVAGWKHRWSETIPNPFSRHADAYLIRHNEQRPVSIYIKHKKTRN